MKYDQQKKEIAKCINHFTLTDNLIAGSLGTATFIQILLENDCLEILNKVMEKRGLNMVVKSILEPKIKP